MASFNYFYISDPGGFDKDTYPQAVPLNGGETVVDVYRDHYWKMGSTLDEIPSIHLKEYKLEYGRWTASLVRMLKVIKGLVKSTDQDPYANMYLGEPTGFNYRFPFLHSEQPIRGVLDNQWSAGSGDVFGLLSQMAPKTSELVNTVMAGIAPGWGTEDIYRYAGTAPRSITLRFPLYNTGDIKSINDNYSFVSLFALQNLKTRTSWTTFLPPKVYTVDTMADGGIYMPMAFVNNFSIQSIGQLRNYTDLGGDFPSNADNGMADYLGFSSSSKFGKLIPEGYLVTIQLTEALPESTNIMVGALGGNKVTVISKQTPGMAGSRPGADLGSGGAEYSVGNMISETSTSGSGSTTSTGSSVAPTPKPVEEAISPWGAGQAPPNTEPEPTTPELPLIELRGDVDAVVPRELPPNIPSPDEPRGGVVAIPNVAPEINNAEINQRNFDAVQQEGPKDSVTPVQSVMNTDGSFAIDPVNLIPSASNAEQVQYFVNESIRGIEKSTLGIEDKTAAVDQVLQAGQSKINELKQQTQTNTDTSKETVERVNETFRGSGSVIPLNSDAQIKTEREFKKPTEVKMPYIIPLGV